MIDHKGNAGEPFTCSGCGAKFKAGRFYHGKGNKIYCKGCDTLR